MKKLFVITLALVMCLSCGVLISSSMDNTQVEAATTDWSNNCATSFAGGTGTSSNPYKISTPAQLAYLASYSQNNSTAGKYYVLTNSLDMSAHNWNRGIGGYISSKYFDGSFDGKGYSISNLSGTNLFGQVKASTFGRYIKNFTLYNYVTTTAGGIIEDCTDYEVSNIKIYGKITRNGQRGGAVINYAHNSTGYLKITNCANYADFQSTASFIGGIVGSLSGSSSTNDAIVDNCLNAGNITGQSEVGGIAGSINNAVVTNCTNLANVKATSYETSGSEAGGILGVSTDVSISYCYNSGLITSNSGYGGTMIGNARRSSISYCINNLAKGKVSGASKTYDIYSGSSYTSSNNRNTATITAMMSTLESNNNEAYASSPTIMDGLPHLKFLYWEDYGK